MLELYGTSDSFKPILDIELDPEETRTQKGANADRAISTLSGRRNRVQIGAADPVLIADNWSKNEQLDDEIRSLLDRYDVYSARFAFSFLADRGCRFVWARVSGHLSTRLNLQEETDCIVLDIFPRQITQTKKVKRTFGVTPKLKLSFFELELKGESSGEELYYEPNMVSAGLLTTSPSWTFTSAGKHGLTATNEIFLLVRAPKNSGLVARFSVGGEVQTAFGPIPLLKYRDPKLLNRKIELA
jgi:hypothetical protein